MSIFLTIIDDQNGSANPRRQRIKSLIEELKLDNLVVVANPTIKKDNNITENSFNMIKDSEFINAGDILLIHSGNRFYKEYVEWLNSKTECLVVIYSGGHSEVENSFSKNLVIQRDGEERQTFQLVKDPALVCAIPHPVNSADDLNITYALKKYCETRCRDEFFNILLKFDPLLEAKLELLHACLTPEGAKNIVDSGFPQNLEKEKEKFWDKKLNELNPSLFNKGNNDTKKYAVYKEWTVEEIVKALSGNNATNKKIEFTDNFDPIYLTALSALRDALLIDHDSVKK